MEEIVKQEGHIVDGSLTDAVHVKLVLLHDARLTHYSHPITEVKSVNLTSRAAAWSIGGTSMENNKSCALVFF